MKQLMAFAAIAVSASSGAQIYRVSEIAPRDTTSVAQAISSSGRVAGVIYTAGGQLHAFSYSGGSLQDLGTLPGGTQSWAYAINDAGQVAGYSATNGAMISHAFVFSNGAMKDIGSLGGGLAVANGINSSGSVVGGSALASGSARAFLYTGGSMRNLGTLGGMNSDAFAINDAGQIAGWSNTAANAPHAFLYSGGAMHDLGVPAGASSSWGQALNSSGQVVGYAEVADDLVHAFLYSNGAMKDIGTLGTNSNSWASGINDSGTVVGYSDTTGNGPFHGFVYSNGSMQDLNSLVDSTGANLSVKYVYGINVHGAIAATVVDQYVEVASVLTPYWIDAPTAYSITAGKYVSGNLGSLANIDQNYLVVQSGPTFSNGSPPLSVVLTGTSTVASPTDVRMQLTGHANSVDLGETVEFYDYVANAWVLVDSTTATASDSTVAAISTNPARFVQSGTLQMRARISLKPSGPISKSPWSLYLDQAVWNVSP